MVLQQMFRYFRLYPSDPPYLKIWVRAQFYHYVPVPSADLAASLEGRHSSVRGEIFCYYDSID